MTASVATRPPATADIGLTFPRIMRSEWLKLKTLRSTWIALGLAIAVLTLAAGLIAHHLHGELAHPRFFDLRELADRDPIGTPLRGFGVTQLIIGVLGVLAVTGEYATGMIRATFGAVPKRLPVLAAKLLVFAVVGFVTMLVATLVAFFTAQAFLGRFSVSLGTGPAFRVVVALSGYLTFVGVLGLALGFVVRSTAGGVAALVGLLLVMPGILAAINTSWSNSAFKYLPLIAGQSMFATSKSIGGGDFTPWQGTGIVFAWVVAAIVAAVVVVQKRDA